MFVHVSVSARVVFYLVWTTYPAGMTDTHAELINQSFVYVRDFVWFEYYLAWSTYPAGMNDIKCGINQSILEPCPGRHQRSPMFANHPLILSNTIMNSTMLQPSQNESTSKGLQLDKVRT
jgi:hypothetical protein